MSRWVGGWLGGWMGGWVGGWVVKCVGGCVGGWGWMDWSLHGCVGERIRIE